MPEPRTPRSTTDRLSARVDDRQSDHRYECFSGYGVMGLPFASGHVLALRHWERSDIGPPYTSIWHRDPSGRWDFWSTQPPALSCNRYTGESVDQTQQVSIETAWLSENRLSVASPEVDLEWEVVLESTAMTRMMGAVSRALPWRLRTHRALLKLMGPLGGRLLGVGRFNMIGRMPNRQLFIAAPNAMWIVSDSRARLRGTDLGPIGPLSEQAGVGDFLMPQRGVLAAGTACFEPLDEVRHSTALVRAQH